MLVTIPTTEQVRVAAYVDGFNLYHGMHAARGRRGLWLDLESLLGSLLGPNQVLVAVHYFTALVVGQPAQGRQQQYLAAVDAYGSVTTTRVGRFQKKTRTCHQCQQVTVTYEEKETDVSLGVQLVEDAAGGAFDQALIVSGDSDMAPALRSARRLQPAARLVAVFPPLRSSYALQNEADAKISIFNKAPEQHQLPEQFVDTFGTTHTRPSYWQ